MLNFISRFYNKNIAIRKPLLPMEENESCKYYLVKNASVPFSKFSVNGLDPEIAASLTQYAKYKQHEYLFHYKKTCFIEPMHGWGISEKGEFIPESIPYSKDFAVPTPSYSDFKKRKKIIDVDIVLSPRFPFGYGNYWHFYNDIIGQLYLAHKYKIDAPVIIPTDAYKIPFIREAIDLFPFLKSKKWIVQDRDTYIRTKEAVFIKNMPVIREHFDFLLDTLNLPRKTEEKKIFLKRNKDRSRYLFNSEEIEAVAKEFGYEIIDSDKLVLKEQIELFSSVKYLIGIHGAGLTNVIYRRGMELNILEIFPKNTIPPHYFWMARNFNFNYDAITGGNETNNSFVLDPVKFKEKLSVLNWR